MVSKYGVHSVIIDLTCWDKKNFNAEFCRYILHTYRKTPTNACRAEIGRYPLVINIQKRAFKCLNHQKSSPIEYPLCQLVLRLTNCLLSDTLGPVSQQHCFATQVEKPILNWKKKTKNQSRFECYLALKKDYELAENLSTVRVRKQRHILTKYRRRDHKLRKGRFKKSWQSKDKRIRGHCSTGEAAL